jgi:hypothetical protein
MIPQQLSSFWYWMGSATGRSSDRPGAASLQFARSLGGRIRLIGLIPIATDQSLSVGARPAGELRQRLRTLSVGVTSSQVLVSHTPWQDLFSELRQSPPDLLVLEWPLDTQIGTDWVVELLRHPPCDVAIVRGPWPESPRRAIVPMRGGPYAELALAVGLALPETQVTTLRLTPPSGPSFEAPYRGIANILRHLPSVRSETAVTADTAATLLEHANRHDVMLLGAAAPSLPDLPIGPITERMLNQAPCAVVAVKTQREMPQRLTGPEGERAGSQAISVLVDKWFAENTFEANEFDDLAHLVDLKHQQGVTISLALPALNEEKTVGKVIETVQRALVHEMPLLDEIVLIDSNSTDSTRDIAREYGIPVYIHQEIFPEYGARRGKGEALWKSLHVTRGDIIAWIDTDIVNIHPRFVYGLLGPLLLSRNVQYVKGFYRRPLRVGDKVQAGGGGRVTELTARPMLNLFYPELSGVIQPLSGEYAGRRAALEQLPFASGYGVEIGLLIDFLEQFELHAIAQVDLHERIHHNQPLEALSKMSFAIIQMIMRRLERRMSHPMLEEVNTTMKLPRHTARGYFVDVVEVTELERPPIIELAEYRARFARAALEGGL